MEILTYPPKERWQTLCRRPAKEQDELEGIVKNILQDVQLRGDQALLDFSKNLMA